MFKEIGGFQRIVFADFDIDGIADFMERTDIVKMCKRKRHVDRFAFIDGEQRQIVDWDNNTHVATFIAFRSKSELIFVAQNVQVGTKLPKLPDNIGKVRRCERELCLVIGVWDIHHIGFEFNQREFKVFVE